LIPLAGFVHEVHFLSLTGPASSYSTPAQLVNQSIAPD
jgi:hypothetical protein